MPREIRAGRGTNALSLAALLSALTVGAGGIGAWYGWTARIQIVEERLTAQAARIDNLLRDVQEHHSLPDHAVGARITEEHERRLTAIERHIADEQQRPIEPIIVQHFQAIKDRLDAIDARLNALARGR